MLVAPVGCLLLPVCRSLILNLAFYLNDNKVISFSLYLRAVSSLNDFRYDIQRSGGYNELKLVGHILTPFQSDIDSLYAAYLANPLSRKSYHPC